ncbi:MAG: hypothetical protein ACRCV9_16445 [Burkholderiaceae bacterium]
MAITSEALLIEARAGARAAPYRKDSVGNTAAGQIFDLWRATGIPTQPAIPAAAAVCDATTVGAISLPFVIAGGKNLFIDAILAQFAIAGQMQFVDRLIHSGGLNATLTTAQAVNTPALPARATPARCRWYIVAHADLGGTGVNATVAVTYTDSTTANLVVAIPPTQRANRKIEIIAGAGKVIASVQTVTQSATTGAAGNYGIVCEMPTGVRAGVLAAGGSIEYESLMRDMQSASPCLSANVLCTTTATGVIDAELLFMQG